MMPTTLVPPFSMRSAPSQAWQRGSSAARRLLRRLGLELLEALREEMVPAVGDPYEVEGVAVGRLERRLDGRGAGVGDRGRRDAGVQARIVRRVAVELALQED